MTRFIAMLFSNAAIAGVFGLVTIGALVRIYGADLPDHDELVDYQPALLSRVYSGEGKVIAEYAKERRVFVPIEEVPQLVKDAFISAEDKNFYDHPGVDAFGIAKAIYRFAEARIAKRPARLAGASTITQQVMKNFLLDRDREIERKIKEMILATRLDGALSKDHILELYLNEIYLGARAYGVAAAARNYFGKSLEEVTVAEAAYLAALPKAPSEMHPIRNRERAIARRNYVLGQMEENDHLDRAEADAAKDAPLVTILDKDVADPLRAGTPNYFTAEVRRQVSREMGQSTLFEGGLTIRATIEADLQQIAAEELRRGLERYDRNNRVYRGPQAVIEAVAAGETEAWAFELANTRLPRDISGWYPAVVLEVHNGLAEIGVEGPEGPVEGILTVEREPWIRRVDRDGERVRPRVAGDIWQVGDAVYVSAPKDGVGEDKRWDLRQIPEVQGGFMAMDPHTGRVLAIQGGFSYEESVFNRATQAQRQPGSAFKPFVYAAALDAGYAPSTIVLDAPVEIRVGGKVWRPKNSSGRTYGPSPLQNGIIYSRNLMTVRVAQVVGMDRVAEYAERFGVYENMPGHLSYALGAGETTLYDMVAAYGMFANGGRRVRPTVVDRIQDRNGETLFRHDPRSCQGCALPHHVAGAEPILFDTRSQIMNPVTAEQLVKMMKGVVDYGTARKTVGGLGFPLAGKTGTTNDSKDAWFVGFSPNMVAGCYIGFDNPRPLGKGAYGGTLCGPVFKRFMARAMETRAPGKFRGAVRGETIIVKVDRETGARLPDDAEGPNVVEQVFAMGREPEIFETAGVIIDDELLFANIDASSLPAEFGVDEALPFEVVDEPVPNRGSSGSGSTGGGSRAPASVGLGTGGLY